MLVHGDCLDELNKLPSNSVDLVCTDPPYGDADTATYGRGDRQIAGNHSPVLGLLAVQKALRILKPAGAAVRVSPRQDRKGSLAVGMGEVNCASSWGLLPSHATSGVRVDLAQRLGRLARYALTNSRRLSGERAR